MLLACLRRGWCLDAADFLPRLTEKFGRRSQPHALARERRKTDTERANPLIRQGLQEVGWTEAYLDRHPKGHPHKIALARQFRRETPMSRDWVAKRLGMGRASYYCTRWRGRYWGLLMVSGESGDCKRYEPTPLRSAGLQTRQFQ